MTETELKSALYAKWGVFNRVHFDEKLTKPLIELCDFADNRRADFSMLADGTPRIRFSRRWFPAEHVSGGLQQLIHDVLLHEMVHHHNHTVWKTPEFDVRKGHGRCFTTMCNRIGKKLGLKRIPAARCRFWPMTCRSTDYYGLTARVPVGKVLDAVRSGVASAFGGALAQLRQ